MSSLKSYANETSYYSAVETIDDSGINFNSNLRIIIEWTFQLKTNFNHPDLPNRCRK